VDFYHYQGCAVPTTFYNLIQFIHFLKTILRLVSSIPIPLCFVMKNIELFEFTFNPCIEWYFIPRTSPESLLQHSPTLLIRLRVMGSPQHTANVCVRRMYS